MKFAILIPYRARGANAYRATELQNLLANLSRVREANPAHEFRVYVIEQDDDQPFNRGWLLNVGFLEAKRDDPAARFVHCNTDYTLPEGPLPDVFSAPLLEPTIIDIHGFTEGLGAFCLFDADAMEKCNGFPNGLWGWGADDSAILRRIHESGVALFRPDGLYNAWLSEIRDNYRGGDGGGGWDEAQRCNAQNLAAAAQADPSDGISSCAYWITGRSDEATERRSDEGEEPVMTGPSSLRAFVASSLHFIKVTQPKKFIVTGGCGFIGSHLVDELCRTRNSVLVLDSLRSGDLKQLHPRAKHRATDIRLLHAYEHLFEGIDGVFHFAAIARTPWCIDEPQLCWDTNIMGTANVCEAARRYAPKARVVLSSSNVVYAFETPYRISKEAGEAIGDCYAKMYGMSVISLRYSNVYGPRQREDGPSPNVFAAFRKSLRETGKIIITGDGEQTRDFTHVSDIVRGNIAAMNSRVCGHLDLATRRNVSMNYVARELFKADIEYIAERPGDVKHILQPNNAAQIELGWEPRVKLEDGIEDVLPPVGEVLNNRDRSIWDENPFEGER